jgi:hypothetical protein
MDEEEEKARAECVRGCLKIITRALISLQKSTEQVFAADGPRLYRTAFIDGLAALEIEPFTDEMITIFMESL